MHFCTGCGIMILFRAGNGKRKGSASVLSCGRGKTEKPLWLMFLLAYLAYSSIYAARLNFSVAAACYEAIGTLNKAQIGIIGSIFSFCYAIGKIPNGYLGDRLSSRHVIVTGLLITGVSNLLIGFLPYFYTIAILWGLNAYGQSMLWGPILRSFSEHYDEKLYRTLMQYLVSAVAAGSILGLILASRCVSTLGVTTCFAIPGLIALVMAALIRFFFLDSPGRQSEHASIREAARAVLRKRRFRQIVFPAMAHGMIKDNINVWLALFFVDCYQTDISRIAGFLFFVPVFALIGRFLYPVFYRLLKNDYRVAFLAFVLCAVSNILLLTGRMNMAGALLCLGADSALVSVINSFMLSQFPAEISKGENLSFTASAMDLITYGGAGIGSVLFGVLIEQFGYQAMFFVWALVSVASAVIMNQVRKESITHPAG